MFTIKLIALEGKVKNMIEKQLKFQQFSDKCYIILIEGIYLAK